MSIDARTYADAAEPWTFTDLTGTSWTPVEISANEVVIWSARFERAASDYQHAASVERRLIRRLFPWRPKYWLSGDPAARFLRLPAHVRRAALDDFFPSRRRLQKPSPSRDSSSRSSTTLPTPSPISAEAASAP